MNRRIPLRRPPARPGAWSESGVLGSTRILFIASLQISTAPSTNRSRPSGENYYATRPHILILYGETFLVYSTSRSPYSPCTSSFSSYSSPFLPLTFPFLPPLLCFPLVFFLLFFQIFSHLYKSLCRLVGTSRSAKTHQKAI